MKSLVRWCTLSALRWTGYNAIGCPSFVDDAIAVTINPVTCREPRFSLTAAVDRDTREFLYTGKPSTLAGPGTLGTETNAGSSLLSPDTYNLRRIAH